MAAASKNLTLLVSSPRLLLLVRNVVPFNFSTAAAVSRHVHSSSSSALIRSNLHFHRIKDFADESEFTVMAWEGIEKADAAARESNVEWVETEHLMKALLEQKDGLARRIFWRAGLDNTSILQATDDFLSKHRKVSGVKYHPIMGQYMSSLLENARKHKNDMKDELVSVEHLILAFHLDRRFGQRLLRNLGVSEKDLREAIDAARVGREVLLNDHWGMEKELMNRIRTLKEEIDGFNVEKEARTLISLQRELEEAEGHLAEIESKWTELVRRRPHCVLLFDQIEKTPQDILNIVSQILEKERITDYQGRTVSFKNTVIILKSHDYDIVKKPLLDSDPPTFLHEFMNHIDHCIVFDTNATKKIAETMMSELEEKLKQRNVELHYTKEVIDTMAKCSAIGCIGNCKIEEFVEHSIARRNFEKDKVCVLNVDVNPDLCLSQSFGKTTHKPTHFLFCIGGKP